MSTHISDKTEILDRAGMTASLLCAVHCALSPFVVALLPLTGLAFLAHETSETVLLMLSGGFAEHNDLGNWGVYGVVLGGLTVASAHWINRKLCLARRVCHHHEVGGCSQKHE